jgi:Cu2+-exporting ATPase
MFCEDDKVYDEAGDCPIGMDWYKHQTNTSETMYTCPMHPEIIQEGRAPVPPAEWI